jgi:hypothetical protein
VNGEWGLRFYAEENGALPLTKDQRLRPDDIVVTNELGRAVDVTDPMTPIVKTMEIRPSIPLRLIGLESHSGYSDVSRGFWPFGISYGVVDRVSAVKVGERHPTLEYVAMDAPSAAEHVVSGIWPADRWMSRAGVVALRNPAEAKPLRATFFITDNARARKVTLLLDGREVASGAYARPGLYTLASAPVRGSGAIALVEIDLDQTFVAPPDTRDLGVVLSGVGFRQ